MKQDGVHTKSRLGCQECKARRIKCDEIHPTCGACRRHFKTSRPCEWIHPHPRRGRRKTQMAPVDVNAVCPPKLGLEMSLKPFGASSNQRRHLLEMRLLHHFTTSTSADLPMSPIPKVAYMWSIYVPQVAFEYDYVLSALLSTAALHMRSLGCKDPEMFGAAVYYFQHALEQHRTAVSHLSSKNAAPLVVCGWLARMLASQLTRGQSGVEADQPKFSLPIYYIHMSRGTLALCRAAAPYIAESPVSSYLHAVPPPCQREAQKIIPLPLIEDLRHRSRARSSPVPKNASQSPHNAPFALGQQPPLEFVHQTGPNVKDQDIGRIKSHVMRSHLRDKRAWREQQQPAAAATDAPPADEPPSFSYLLRGVDPTCDAYDAYATYTAMLNETLHEMMLGEPLHYAQLRVCNHPPRTLPGFVKLIEEEDPLALTMYAHHFALLKLVGGSWWLRGTGEYNFNGARKLVPKEWDWAMRWPAAVMEWEEE